MEHIIVYISYAQEEYRNYFHLACSQEVVLEYCPEEKEEDLFQKLQELKRGEKGLKLCIVQDENASQWDYRKAFLQHGMELEAGGNLDLEQLCLEMEHLFGREYGVGGQDDGLKKRRIRVLYPDNCVSSGGKCETGEALRQAKEILEHGGEEMTELARIIKEKYERMNRHE